MQPCQVNPNSEVSNKAKNKVRSKFCDKVVNAVALSLMFQNQLQYFLTRLPNLSAPRLRRNVPVPLPRKIELFGNRHYLIV